jgi:hypothetical protein
LQLHNQDKCLGKVKLVLQEAVHVQHFHKVVEDGAVSQGLFLVGTDFLGQQDQEGHPHLFQVKLLLYYMNKMCLPDTSFPFLFFFQVMHY